MKFIKTTMVCAILMAGFIIAGCQKEKYVSRDTSGLKPPPPVDTTKPPVVDTSVVIDNADKLDGWSSAGDASLATTGQKEGTGYIKNSIKAGSDFMQFIKTLPAPVNTKVSLTTGELEFWFYVQDVSLLKLDGQIQFSSSGDPDKNRIGWAMDKIIPNLKNGWNHLELKFIDGQTTGDGGPDLKAMNFFKMFFWSAAKATADQQYGIDDIRVAAVPPPADVVVDNCDSKDGWASAGDPTLATSGQKEGTGYIKNNITIGNDFMQFIKPLAAPINTNETLASGELKFWFYVQDVSLLKLDGQIQFSSSGDPDKNPIGWAMDKIIPTLKNGWNHLELKFSDGQTTGDGGPDLTAMNYFKMFFWSAAKATSDQTYGIDDVRVVAKP
ncbi:hypothetical protein [Mucilaginibacter ginsenosidivorax]|uniref:CBM11 domain-containing protein n=1 Tax=Mucilaginibacter ginsenosidivorax TaxID=862126 RepID=A0A5B8WAU8_9SPHI|nr:hypothetical protein [Mucilaginibacter ginsenosidivorax]QEC80015.1 hypothetical protein FSB76_30185 [Mucilaginibacter ginsenosidivorax]